MKQHEVLAIEKDKKNKKALIYGEAGSTFEKKISLFNGFNKKYDPFDQEDPTKQLPSEINVVTEKVIDKVHYVENFIADHIDMVMTKEMTNSKGHTAVVEFGDKKISLSSIALLALEKEIKEFKVFLVKVPTLPNDQVWLKSESDPDIWNTEEKEKLRTVKTNKPVTMYPHTDKHPAQTQMSTEDVPVGKWKESLSSSCLTSKEKADMINRADELIATIQAALSKANDVEVEPVKVGKDLLDYIVGK